MGLIFFFYLAGALRLHKLVSCKKTAWVDYCILNGFVIYLDRSEAAFMTCLKIKSNLILPSYPQRPVLLNYLCHSNDPMTYDTETVIDGEGIDLL